VLGRLTSGHGIGVAATNESVLKATNEKASSDDVEKYILLFGWFVWDLGIDVEVVMFLKTRTREDLRMFVVGD
jgi:hypothetical protein